MLKGTGLQDERTKTVSRSRKGFETKENTGRFQKCQNWIGCLIFATGPRNEQANTMLLLFPLDSLNFGVFRVQIWAWRWSHWEARLGCWGWYLHCGSVKRVDRPTDPIVNVSQHPLTSRMKLSSLRQRQNQWRQSQDCLMTWIMTSPLSSQ